MPDRRRAIDDVATGSYLRGMRAIGIKILKNRLSEYVKLAAAGEIVLVMDRDRVVAELGPPAAGRAAALADVKLAEAVRRGWLTPPVGSPGLPPRGPAVAPLRELLAELAADREDR